MEPAAWSQKVEGIGLRLQFATGCQALQALQVCCNLLKAEAAPVVAVQAGCHQVLQCRKEP